MTTPACPTPLPESRDSESWLPLEGQNWRPADLASKPQSRITKKEEGPRSRHSWANPSPTGSESTDQPAAPVPTPASPGAPSCELQTASGQGPDRNHNDNHSHLCVILAFVRAFLLPYQEAWPLRANTAKQTHKSRRREGGDLPPSQKCGSQSDSVALEQK